MLQRGMANRDIQFYFNRPDRPVNNGRISEIKAGDRGVDVLPASDFELDKFLDNDPLTAARRPAEVPVLPPQASAASQFTVNGAGEIDIIPDPPSIQDGELAEELFGELVHKSDYLLAIGDNALGASRAPLERFIEVLPANLADEYESCRTRCPRPAAGFFKATAELPD